MHRWLHEHCDETGQVTGTKDRDYNLIWSTEVCLSNVLRLETYAADAQRDGDTELAEFFRRAQGESRKGAEHGKQMLRLRLDGQQSAGQDSQSHTGEWRETPS